MAQYWIRAELLSGLETLLKEEFSVSLVDLAAKVKFDFSSLQNIEEKIPLDTTIKLLEDCASYTNCDSLGVMLGHTQRLDMLGSSYALGKFTDFFGDAVEQIFDRVSLSATGVKWQLTKDEHFAYTTVFLNSSHAINHQQAIYVTMVQVFKLLKSLSNNQWQPTRIYFTYPAPSDLKYFRAVFGTKIYFNMDFNGFIFSAEQLNLPIVTCDQSLNSMISDYLKLSGKSQSDNKLKQIELSIQSSLLLQHSCSLTEIAASQSQTPRAIQYYLKNFNLSYQQLLNNVRYELASELLSGSEQPIYAISALVGFSDSTVFSKGFKKHMGETPSKYRQKYKTL